VEGRGQPALHRSDPSGAEEFEKKKKRAGVYPARFDVLGLTSDFYYIKFSRANWTTFPTLFW
jgi:hypothetical protein